MTVRWTTFFMISCCDLSNDRLFISAFTLDACSQRVRGEKFLIVLRVQIVDVSQEELEVALAERSKPMIIDFYASWCGPCVLLADELKKVRCGTVTFLSYHEHASVSRQWLHRHQRPIHGNHHADITTMSTALKCHCLQEGVCCVLFCLQSCR